MRKLIHVDATGYIDGTSTTEGYGSATPAPGWHDVPMSTDLPTVLHRQFNPQTGAIGPVRPAPRVRAISVGAWMDRWTDAEQIALEAVGEAQTPQGRAVRVMTRRLFAVTSGMVDLDSDALAAGLQQVKAVLMAPGVAVWADEATANARIAALLADG